MKTLHLLAVGVILSAVQINAQSTQTSTTQLNAQIKIEELNAAIAELEKERAKTLKSIERNQKSLNDLDRELDFNAEKIADNTSEVQEVEASMNGLVLSTMNDKIKEIEKHKVKQERKLEHNHKSISKKSAQIQKLTLEIEQMENENITLQDAIENDVEEIKETQDVISDNNLVSKTETLKKLNKTGAQLAKERNKLIQKSGRTKETIARENSTVAQKESTLTKMQQEKQVLKRTTGKASAYQH